MPDKSRTKKTIDSFQHEKIIKDLERLIAEASQDNYQAQVKGATLSNTDE
jgi:hypothetical protein